MFTDSKTQRWGTSQKIVLWIGLAILVFFLLAEHRAHFLGALPWLLLAACPLLHVFMHRGHGGHGHSDPSSQDEGGKQ